jgi:hypothetical protein
MDFGSKQARASCITNGEGYLRQTRSNDQGRQCAPLDFKWNRKDRLRSTLAPDAFRQFRIKQDNDAQARIAEAANLFSDAARRDTPGLIDA